MNSEREKQSIGAPSRRSWTHCGFERRLTQEKATPLRPPADGSPWSRWTVPHRSLANVGVVDLILDYYHATQVGLPALAGQLGATYAIPIIYVPVLMITHVVAFYLLLRPQPKAVRALAGDAAAS